MYYTGQVQKLSAWLREAQYPGITLQWRPINPGILAADFEWAEDFRPPCVLSSGQQQLVRGTLERQGVLE